MPRDVGAITKQLFDIKQRKAALNAEVKELSNEQYKVEAELLAAMKEHKLNKLSTDEGSVYITRKVVPKVVEWEAFYEYIAKNNYFHLLQRRPSATSYEEFYELGEQIPGVEPLVFDEVRTRKS